MKIRSFKEFIFSEAQVMLYEGKIAEEAQKGVTQTEIKLQKTPQRPIESAKFATNVQVNLINNCFLPFNPSTREMSSAATE